jgi:hypothetical protein
VIMNFLAMLEHDDPHGACGYAEEICHFAAEWQRAKKGPIDETDLWPFVYGPSVRKTSHRGFGQQ